MLIYFYFYLSSLLFIYANFAFALSFRGCVNTITNKLTNRYITLTTQKFAPIAQRPTQVHTGSNHSTDCEKEADNRKIKKKDEVGFYQSVDSWSRDVVRSRAEG